MTDEVAYLPARELAALVRARQISAVELVELYLGRIEALDGRLDSYLTVAADQARAAARDADRLLAAAGDAPVPPFLGVPVSVKDLTDTAGIRTTLGTAGFADRVPDVDAEVVARLRASGMVLLGKTNTPELGAAPVTETPAYPPARNPWDPGRSPGGSSGGAAAALAAGLCAVAHGTDGAGSIRIPSSLCGVFGLKPSRGRVSSAPRAADLLSQHGPITRTVEDAAAVLDAIAGPVVGDAWWAPPPSTSFLAQSRAPVGRLRIATTTTPFVPGAATSPAIGAVTESVAATLSDLGHHVSVAAPPWPFELVVDELAVAGAYLAARAADLPSIETLDPVNRFLVSAGRMLPAHEVLRIQERLLVGSRAAAAFFESYDVLLTPTVPVPAPRVGEWTALTSGTDVSAAVAAIVTGRGDVPPLLWLAAFTSPWNVTGQPAVSVPAGSDADGLPVGVQLVGPPAGEGLLLALSAQLEAARPWRERRPAVS